MSFLKSLFGAASPKKVSLSPSGAQFDMGKGETVLETALKKGIAYPHDCTVGTCGACRSRLISGRVEAITPFGYTLSREELDAGYILACQAIPKSDLVLDVEIKARPDMPLVRTKATLTSVEELTHDIMRVTWTLSTPLNWNAGQYVNVIWNHSDVHRSYSFATAPQPEGSSEIQTFVRHVPGGAFTDSLFAGELHNADFEIEGPHGDFWLREGTSPIVCIAGGSGLAPIISLLSDAANHKVRRDCILLFGARTIRDLYADEEIARIRHAWTANFEFWPVLSEERSSSHRQGLVTAYIDEALERLGLPAQGYMCGPPPMVDAAITALTARGITLADIHYDKFTDAGTKKVV